MTIQKATIKFKIDIKIKEFIVVVEHPDLDVYYTKPVNGDSWLWLVN